MRWVDTSRLTVDDQTGDLFWDGKKVKTESKLAWPERALATVATASSCVIALMSVLNFLLK